MVEGRCGDRPLTATTAWTATVQATTPPTAEAGSNDHGEERLAVTYADTTGSVPAAELTVSTSRGVAEPAWSRTRPLSKSERP